MKIIYICACYKSRGQKIYVKEQEHFYLIADAFSIFIWVGFFSDINLHYLLKFVKTEISN